MIKFLRMTAEPLLIFGVDARINSKDIRLNLILTRVGIGISSTMSSSGGW